MKWVPQLLLKRAAVGPQAPWGAPLLLGVGWCASWVGRSPPYTSWQQSSSCAALLGLIHTAYEVTQ